MFYYKKRFVHKKCLISLAFLINTISLIKTSVSSEPSNDFIEVFCSRIEKKPQYISPYSFPAEINLGLMRTPFCEASKEKSPFSLSSESYYLNEVVQEGELYRVKQKNEKIEEKIQATVIQGKDGRELVMNPSHQMPYKAIGYMEMKFGSKKFLGTGTLVGPRHLLTAAHNIYNCKTKKYATQIEFFPGRNGPISSEDYRSTKGIQYFIPFSYKTAGSKENDFALIVLDYPIGYETGWLGIVHLDSILMEGRKFIICGYPGDKQIHGHGPRQWQMAYTLDMLGDNLLDYQIDTNRGQSGSGILCQLEDSQQWYIAGVHTYGIERSHNGGVRINRENFEKIIRSLSISQYDDVLNFSFPNCFNYQDKEKFHLYKRQARKQKNPKAQYNLSIAYETGKGTKVNEDRALKWAQRSADQGHLEAQLRVGQIFENRKQYELAATYYNKAAMQDCHEAEDKLGKLYEQGKGVIKSLSKAYWCYLRAKESSFEEVKATYKIPYVIPLELLQSLNSDPEDVNRVETLEKLIQNPDKGVHINLSKFENFNLLYQVFNKKNFIVSIDFSNSRLGNKEVVEFSSILCNLPLVRLNLSSNNIKRRGLKALCEAIEPHAFLKELRLENNPFGWRCEVEPLTHFLETNSKLEYLALDYPQIFMISLDKIKFLKFLETCWILEYEYDLLLNNLNGSMEEMGSNKTITHLTLDLSTCYDDLKESLKILYSSLKRNRTLKYLNLITGTVGFPNHDRNGFNHEYTKLSHTDIEELRKIEDTTHIKLNLFSYLPSPGERIVRKTQIYPQKIVSKYDFFKLKDFDTVTERASVMN